MAISKGGVGGGAGGGSTAKPAAIFLGTGKTAKVNKIRKNLKIEAFEEGGPARHRSNAVPNTIIVDVGTGAGTYTRVYVDRPTILRPMRNDPLTGSGDLQYMRFGCTPVNPYIGGLTNIPIYESGKYGTVFLFEAGEWFIRGQCAVDTKVMMRSIPVASPEFLTWIMSARHGTRTFVVRHTLAALGSPVKILSVQQLLDQNTVVSLVTGATGKVRLSWGVAPTSGNHFELGDYNEMLLSSTLPIMDLWADNTLGSTERISVIRSN